MEDLFNILSSSARLDKSKRKVKRRYDVEPARIPVIEPSKLNDSSSGEDELETKKNRRSASKQAQIHQESVSAFRRKLNIRLSQDNKNDPNVPDPIASFDELSVPNWWSGDDAAFESTKRSVCHNIEQGRWVNPTPIQMQCLPAMLSTRRDVLACAPTGSGKSGAFIIPSIFLASASHSVFYGSSSLDAKDDDHSQGAIRALLLAPSRELASQLYREVQRLSQGRSIKSVLLSKQNTTFGGKRGTDILISTPLRLVQSLQRNLFHLGHVRIVVMDEADRLLDATDGGSPSSNDSSKNEETNADDDDQDNSNNNNKQSGSKHVQSFLEQMDYILSQIPKSALRALFSATMGHSVRNLAESILRNPVDVAVNAQTGGVNTNIDQNLLFCGKEEGKLLAIRQLIQKGIQPPVIVFMQNKARAQALFQELKYDSINVDVLHAGRSQAARDASVAKFRKGDTWLLICTDLCARGVDFKAVNLVINYDLPTSAITYIHRIGRCGRAGRHGKAITLFTEADFQHLRTIANVMKLSGCTNIPDWMLKSLPSNKRGHGNAEKRIQMERRNPKRYGIDTTPVYDRKRQKSKRSLKNGEEEKRRRNDAKRRKNTKIET